MSSVERNRESKKIAAFVMDVEDWYHLDYIDRRRVDCHLSVLDGVDRFADLLLSNGINNATFSIVGDLVAENAVRFERLYQEGFELACHDWDHVRPVEKDSETFRSDTLRVKKALEDITGSEIAGYRAPSYGIDRERVDILKELGFKYDASRIDFRAHKLYGQVDMTGFQQIRKNVWHKSGFYEFGVGTVTMGGITVPVSGGGYIRSIPWPVMSLLIKRYIKDHDFYLFYIHPYEMTTKPLPALHSGIKLTTRVKYRINKDKTPARIQNLINLLNENDFTYMSLRQCAEYYQHLQSASG